MGYYTVLIISHDENPAWNDAKTVKIFTAISDCLHGCKIPPLPSGVMAKQFHNTDKDLQKIRNLVK
jgi:hypothetical protein